MELMFAHWAGRDSALTENMDTAKHCEVHSARKWDPCGTDLPAWLKSDQASKVEENPHFSKNTNKHSAAGFGLHLDKMKMMDRTFLIHTSLDEVQHPWVSKGRRWKELLESWVLRLVCRALCSCWGLQEARVLSRIKQLQLCFVSTS